MKSVLFLSLFLIRNHEYFYFLIFISFINLFLIEDTLSYILTRVSLSSILSISPHPLSWTPPHFFQKEAGLQDTTIKQDKNRIKKEKAKIFVSRLDEILS